MTLSHIFERFRAPLKRSSHRHPSSRSRRHARLALQRLEDRLALAFTVEPVPLTTDPATFAYNIYIDDQVNGSGDGRDVFIQHSTDGSPYFLVADNAAFNNAQRLGSLLVGLGECTTVFATTAARQGPSALLATPNVFASTYTFTLPNPNPVTLSGTLSLDQWQELATVNPASAAPASGVRSGNTITNITGANLSNVVKDTIVYAPGFVPPLTKVVSVGSGSVTLDKPVFGAGAFPFTFYSPTALFNGEANNSTTVSASSTFGMNSSDILLGASIPNDTTTVSNITPAGFDTSSPVTITPAPVTFDYDSDGTLPFAGGSLTVSAASTPAWAAAGYGIPTAFVFGLTLTFSFWQTGTPPTVPKLLDGAPFAPPVVTTHNAYSYYTTSITNPQSFTAFASARIPDQRLIVDLQPVGSRISIATPWNASRGSANDPGFYDSYGGYVTGGQVALYASEITVSSELSSSSRINFNSSSQRYSGFTTPLTSLVIDDRLNADDITATLRGGIGNPASMVVTPAGAIDGSGSLTVTAEFANVRAEGQVTAPTQTYLLSAIGSNEQYVFTTRSASTGINTGVIRGTSTAITMGQPAGGSVDLRTDLQTLRFQSGTTNDAVPYRYAVTIEEINDLTVDAVASSSGPIAVRAGSNLTIKGNAVRTSDDLTFEAVGTLAIQGSVATANGDVRLAANALNLTSTVNAGGGRNVSLQSTTGATSLNALAQAGGGIKRPVRVATTANLTLSGLATQVDGVTLAAGDRVLVKNQTLPTENGIYIAAANAWSRAPDANTSALLTPGFAVFATEGTTQKGGWVFLNPVNPILSQSGLAFVPLTATRVFDEVDAATTAAGGNIALSGLQTIDGILLVAGRRVLVKDQTNPAQNGIYVVAAGAWSRASDADAANEMIAGAYVFVRGGTANAGSSFALTSDAVQIGTSPLAFAPFTIQTTRTNTWSPANVLAVATVATTANIALSRLQTIDGVLLQANDRVLVKHQLNPADNGVYFAASGAWSRATDADSGTELARGTTVYVSAGTLGASTAWEFDDSIRMTGDLSINSTTISNLTSIAHLRVGMLVAGRGIPANTTIAGFGGDGTSLRLSVPATATRLLTPLKFIDIGAVTLGATPLVFIPAGGEVDVTAATSITTSNALIDASTALLTAGALSGGSQASSLINTRTSVGRVNATAPASITLVDDGAVTLADIRSTAAGSISVTATSLIAASSLVAKGTPTIPGAISLLSTSSDIVAGVVTTDRGAISLISTAGSIVLPSAPLAANVSTGNGSVLMNADKGVISINGRVNAQGTGSDVTLSSNNGSLNLGVNAVIAADDQLRIFLPNNGLTVASGMQSPTAARLSLTSQLGLATAPPASLGTYSVVELNRTDAGNILFSSPTALTVEGATTLNGSIAFSAPTITVSGGIAPTGVDADISLVASAGDLIVASPLASQRDITLSAPAGKISNATGAATALLTAPRNVIATAAGLASLNTKAAALQAALSGRNASLEVTEADDVTILNATLSGGGTATINIGSAAAGGKLTIAPGGSINATDSGTVNLLAYADIAATRDTAADIVAATATLVSTTGGISVDTDVDTLTVSSGQRNSLIDVDDVAVRTMPRLAVSTGTGNDGNVDITSPRTIVAGPIATTGNVTLQATGVTADILVSNIASANGIVSLSAGRSIVEATPIDTTADITATSVRLLAARGSIDSHINAVTIAAEATTVDQTLTIRADGPLSVGTVLGTNGITGRAVTITTGVAGGAGSLSQTQPVTATSLTITNTGNAGDVTLLSTANSTPLLTIANPGRNVSYRNATILEIASGGIQAATVALTVAGSLTDTGAITATSALAVTGNGSAITLDNAANDTASLAIANPGGSVTYRDASGFDIGTAGIQGSTVALIAAGPITDTGAIVATSSLTITGNGSAITLDNAANDTPALAIANAGGVVTYRDANGFDIGAAGIQGSAVSLTAAGPITDSGAIAATSSLTISGNGSAIALDNAATDTPARAIANAGGAVTYRDASGFDVGTAGIQGAAVSLTAAGTITDTGAIVASSSLTISGNGSAITLDSAANDTASLTIDNAGGAVTYRDASGFDVGSAGIRGTVVSLTAAGPITDTGAIIATTSLDAVVNATGAIVLDTATNAVALFTAQTSVGDVVFVNGNTFSTGIITAGTTPVGDGNILLKAVTGNIVVTGNLSAPNDKITLEARAGTFTLNNGVSLGAGSLVYYVVTPPNLGTGTTLPVVVAPNGVWTITGSAIAISGLPISTFDGDISIIGTTLNVDGALRALGANRRITIATTNGVTGGGSLVATELVITNGANAVALTGNNNFDSVSIANPGRPVSYRDANGFSIGSAGIQGSTVALNAAGSLAQIGPATASSLEVAVSSGIVSLGNAGNDVGSLSISNPGRFVTFNDSNALTIAGIQSGNFSLTTGGAVTQTGPLSVSTLSATTPGSLALTNVGNSIPAINQVIAGSTVTIVTTGNLSIGPAAIPTALLKSTTQVNLAGVAGSVMLENGGRIDAPSIILGTGDSIVISVGAGDGATALGNAIVSANQMPGVPTTISLAAGSTVSLTEALPPVDSPIVMVGNGSTIQNAGAVAVGLLLLDGSSGSQISGVTFQGFTSAGLALDGSQNTTISGVTFVGNSAGLGAQGNLAGTRVIGSTFQNNTVGAALQNATNLVFGGIGAASNVIASASRTSTGLLISGTSNGTRVIGNRFSGHAQAIQLTSATGVTVGGRARGEGNTISGAARAGVFASGFCTRSQVIKTVFARTPRTPTPFNVRSARGLRVVR
ncbi:MAG: beta strand repeat-containing protein [Planctomycetia bacterium]